MPRIHCFKIIKKLEQRFFHAIDKKNNNQFLQPGAGYGIAGIIARSCIEPAGCEDW